MVLGNGSLACAAARWLTPRGSVDLIWDAPPRDLPHGASFTSWDLTDPSALMTTVEKVAPDFLFCAPQLAEETTLLDDPAGYCADFARLYFSATAALKATIDKMLIQGSGQIVIAAMDQGLSASDDLRARGAVDWALAALGESLSGEVQAAGIHVSTIRANQGDEGVVQRGLEHAFSHRRVEIFPQSGGRLKHMSDRLRPAVAGRAQRPELRQISFDTVLVTGASSGLGRRLALMYAPRTRRLCITARRLEKLEELRAEILANAECEVEIIPADMTQRSQLDALIDQVGEVDAIINCAGRHLISTVVETTMETYQDFFRLNFLGPAYLLGSLAKRSTQLKKVVNVLSTSAIRGRRKRSAYAGTKAALWALTRAFRNHHDGKMQVIEVIASTFSPNPSPKDGRRFARTPSTEEVAKIIYEVESTGREYAYAPTEVRLFLSLAALAPSLFARIFP
jgi:short-subunit dehydrogenase